MHDRDVAASRQWARILVLLDAAGHAGVVPMPILQFHAFAYLANLLAPVWSMSPLDGKVLKRQGGPFYPNLQQDLDRLVGLGLVVISDVSHICDTFGAWRLDGKYQLQRELSKGALRFLQRQPEDRAFVEFSRELAYALSSLEEGELERALMEDATYANPDSSTENVIDFGEWQRKNPSLEAIKYFDHFLPSSTATTPGEKLHLYVRHLRRRMHA